MLLLSKRLLQVAQTPPVLTKKMKKARADAIKRINDARKKLP